MNKTQLDEATATALAIIVHNHIEALKVWERKLRTPYMPTTQMHLSVVPQYPKPTLNTMLHVAETGKTFQREVVRMATTFMKEKLLGEDHGMGS